MQAAETGISNSVRADLPEGLANHLRYVRCLDFGEGHVLGETSRPSQAALFCRARARCCFKAPTLIMSMSSARMQSSYPVARTALNMDQAQLCRERLTAALQQSNAMTLKMEAAGLQARLFQNLAARKSQTHACCMGCKPSFAKRMSVGVLLLTPAMSLSICRWLVANSSLRALYC